MTPVAGCGGSLLHTGALDVNALLGYVCMEVRKSVVDDRGVVQRLNRQEVGLDNKRLDPIP